MTIKKYWPYIFLLLANFIYGVNFSIAKMVMPDYIQPFGFVLLRALTAMIFFIVLFQIWPTKDHQAFSRKEWLQLMACALFGVALNQLNFFKGLELTLPISAAIIMTTVPILVLILSYFILKNALGVRKIVGILLGMIGAIVIIVNSDNPQISAENPLLGNLLIFINATSYALYLIIAKPLLAKHDSVRILKWVFTFGFLFILPFGSPQLLQVEWESIPKDVWFAIGFVLIFVSCFTYLFNLLALQKVNPSTVSVFIYSQPIFAILIAYISGKDSLNIVKIVGALLIFLGVYFVINTNFKKKEIE